MQPAGFCRGGNINTEDAHVRFFLTFKSEPTFYQHFPTATFQEATNVNVSLFADDITVFICCTLSGFMLLLHMKTDARMCDSSVLPPGVCVENVGTTTRLRYCIPALCSCPGLHPFSNDIQLMCSVVTS